MARQKIATAIQLDGPFFARRPGATFRQNARILLAELAREGEADVKAQLHQSQGNRVPLRHVTPDRVAGHVVGRTKSLSGKPWQVTAVVSVNNSGLTRNQGKSLMAAASEIERRSHVFRRTTTRLRKARKINAAELLRGIA